MEVVIVIQYYRADIICTHIHTRTHIILGWACDKAEVTKAASVFPSFLLPLSHCLSLHLRDERDNEYALAYQKLLWHHIRLGVESTQGFKDYQSIRLKARQPLLRFDCKFAHFTMPALSLPNASQGGLARARWRVIKASVGTTHMHN